MIKTPTNDIIILVIKMYKINDVLILLKEHIFFSKEKAKDEPCFYKLVGNKVHCFNSHYSFYLSINEFKEKYKDTIFYLYEDDDEELEPNNKYYRQ